MAAVLTSEELAKRRLVQAKLLQSGSIISRADWKASPPIGTLEYDWFYDSIVVHYTGHQSYPTMKSIQRLDTEHGRQWQDIAYHYAIAQTGQIYEGREILFKGSDVFHQNTGKIGIVCMGDFDSNVENFVFGKSYSGDAIPAVMMRSLETLTTLLRRSFPLQFFGGHIEYGRTAVCPGSNLLPLVQAMRTKLKFQAPTFRNLE